MGYFAIQCQTMSRLKQLGKDSVIYGIGGIFAKSVSFFLLPVYTRIFTPADYGTIEMMTVIVSFLTAFLVMGMDSAQSFYFFEQKQNGKLQQKIMVSAILQWRLTWGLGVVLTAGGLAPLINTWFFGAALPLSYFAISFAGALFGTVMSQSVEIFRLLYRPWPYIGVTIVNTVLTASLVLGLVLGLDQGINGFFLGTAIGSFATALFGWFLVRDYLDFSKWHREWWPRLLKFGVPLLPSGLAFYAMSTADRWFVQYYHGAEALGLYAVGAKFSMLMALGIETFRKAWWPMAMDAMHSVDGPQTFRMIARLFMGLGVAGVVYLTFLSPWLVKWTTGPEFHGAYPMVGVLAWQSLFYGFFLVGSAGIWKAEKTYITVILMGLTGVINILLNIWWVPTNGGMGAALATAVSYFFWNIASLVISERYWRVNFPIWTLMAQIALGACVGALLIWGDLTLWYSVVLTHVAIFILIASSLDSSHWHRVLQKTQKVVSLVK